MLHIVKSVQALEDALRVLNEQDKLLLVEQAVYAANPQHQAFHRIKGLDASVLQADLNARGIANRVSPSLQQVDFEGFVELTVEQANSITWE